MPPFQNWLRRADADAAALILPERRLSYGELRALPPRAGLHALEGDAAALALGLVECALGGGTAFPLPPGLDAAYRERLLNLAAAAASLRLALIIATSGSEGNPKGVRLPWRAVAAAARMSARALELRAGDAWLACMPLHHVGGAMIVYRCLRAGATAVVHEGFDADAVTRDLAARRITHLSLVPPMLARLLDAGVRPASSLRCVLVGGAALSLPLFRRAVAAGWPVCPTYGMTESCAQATVALRPGLDAWQEGNVGVPLPGVRIDTAPDGTLRVATPARMAGYLGDAGPAPQWLSTRDLGWVDAAGRVHVAGRADDMLVSAGVNVHPLEVESRLAACPGVREAGVVGLADPVWGDVIAAAYEGAIGETDLENWCREQLPAARRPRRFLRVAALPRTPSGKLDRRALSSLWGSPSPLAGEGLGRGGSGMPQRDFAKHLRRHLTDSEQTLWRHLRAHRLNGEKFRRQQPIGPYVVDFVHFGARLIVEADGGQHCDSPHDEARDAWLRAQGFRVMRFWNNDIMGNPEGVLAVVLAGMESQLPGSPLPRPLSREGRGEKGGR